MAGYRRVTNTPPVIDIDGSMWSVFVSDEPDPAILIQVCDGITVNQSGPTERLLGLLGDARPLPSSFHEFDGDFHDGDIHLFLDHDAAHRLLCQLQQAFAGKPATEAIEDGVEVVGAWANRVRTFPPREDAPDYCPRCGKTYMSGESSHTDCQPRPMGRFCYADCPDCESGN